MVGIGGGGDYARFDDGSYHGSTITSVLGLI